MKNWLIVNWFKIAVIIVLAIFLIVVASFFKSVSNTSANAESTNLGTILGHNILRNRCLTVMSKSYCYMRYPVNK